MVMDYHYLDFTLGTFWGTYSSSPWKDMGLMLASI